MRKTIILVFVFIALAGIAWFLISERSTKSTVDPEFTDLYVADTDRIHRIFLADRNGNKILLKRNPGNALWTLNERYEARPWSVVTLLSTIRDMRIKYRPTNAAIEKIMPAMASESIKVELYDRDGDKFKVFYVGPTTNDERGTYMMLEGTNKPTVMHIPMWEGSLRARFFTDEGDWRDKALVREDPEEIVAISVEYPKQRSNSFKLIRNNGSFNVKPFYEVTPEISGVPQKGKCEAYLQGFEELIAEGFENMNPKRDSIVQTIPFSIVTLKRADGSDKTIKFYPFLYPQLESFDADYHIDRYYAEVEEGDFFVVQYQLIKRFFWPYEFFYEPY